MFGTFMLWVVAPVVGTVGGSWIAANASIRRDARQKAGGRRG